jgi:hypothetical protein
MLSMPLHSRAIARSMGSKRSSSVAIGAVVRKSCGVAVFFHFSVFKIAFFLRVLFFVFGFPAKEPRFFFGAVASRCGARENVGNLPALVLTECTGVRWRAAPMDAHMLGDVVIALDIEATGPQVGTHVIVAIGGVAVDAATQRDVDSMLLKLDTRGCEWDAHCVATFWDKHPGMRDMLTTATNVGADVLLSREQAATRLDAWIRHVRERARSVELLSDCPQFDGGWLDALLAEAGLPPLHLPTPGEFRPMVDTRSTYKALAWAASVARVKPLPVDVSELPRTHNPLDDARHIAVRHLRTQEAFRALFRGLGSVYHGGGAMYAPMM